MNDSEDVIQRLGECHIRNTFQEDIFIAALEDIPSESGVHQVDGWSGTQGPKFPGAEAGALSATPARTAVETGGSSHTLWGSWTCVKFRSEDACFPWHLHVAPRTPKREEKNTNPPGFMTGLLFTRMCLLLDNLDENVTASLHVLQIHGIKPLEQLMKSSHIISC